MPRALKGQMPRVFGDHRSSHAKQLREVYLELNEKYLLKDGISRRIAVIVARAWLDYEAITKEVIQLSGRRRHHQKIATMQTRLRRRQVSYAGQFLGGLRTLDALTNGGARFDLAKQFQESFEGLDP